MYPRFTPPALATGAAAELWRQFPRLVETGTGPPETTQGQIAQDTQSQTTQIRTPPEQTGQAVLTQANFDELTARIDQGGDHPSETAGAETGKDGAPDESPTLEALTQAAPTQAVETMADLVLRFGDQGGNDEGGNDQGGRGRGGGGRTWMAEAREVEEIDAKLLEVKPLKLDRTVYYTKLLRQDHSCCCCN